MLIKIDHKQEFVNGKLEKEYYLITKFGTFADEYIHLNPKQFLELKKKINETLITQYQ